MTKFKNITSSVVPLPIENVDTDQIIPARYLKATNREGFGKNLFYDWRYQADGQPKAEFVLNNPLYKGPVLVCGKNFGCGSSREHAVWALYDYGFRVVVSSFFADIFRNNSLNNGLLPIQVPDAFLNEIFEQVKKDANAQVTVDLEKQIIRIEATKNEFRFEINSFKKHCMLEGLSELDYLISLKPKIEEYEKTSILKSIM
jgi:3-isopropylmalate/(R)-2-methylmalate dehydratase small subunit